MATPRTPRPIIVAVDAATTADELSEAVVLAGRTGRRLHLVRAEPTAHGPRTIRAGGADWFVDPLEPVERHLTELRHALGLAPTASTATRGRLAPAVRTVVRVLGSDLVLLVDRGHAPRGASPAAVRRAAGVEVRVLTPDPYRLVA